MGKLGQAQGSFQFFFSVLYLFINLVYNECLYYCSSCMLEQILYLEKFWFLRYGPKCSWPIRLRDFSIDCRTLKLVVSHKEINEINCFLVCPTIFSAMDHQVFLIFGTMVDNSNIEKLTEPLFPGKFIFDPNLGKKGPEYAQNRPKIEFLEFF